DHLGMAAGQFRLLADLEAERGPRHGNRVSDQPFFEIGLVLADDRKNLLAPVIALYRHTRGEGDFLRRLGRLYRLSGSAALRPVTQIARRARYAAAIAFMLRMRQKLACRLDFLIDQG